MNDEQRSDLMGEIRYSIAMSFGNGETPPTRFFGECAAIFHDSENNYIAYLYIWDESFNDSAKVADWFHNVGAISVTIKHVLFCSINNDRNGKCDDGAQPWVVYFRMPEEVAA